MTLLMRAAGQQHIRTVLLTLVADQEPLTGTQVITPR